MSSIYGTSLLNNYGLSSLYGNSLLGNSQTSNNSLNSIFSMMLLSMLGQTGSSNSLFGNSSFNTGTSNYLNLFQSLLGNAGKTPVTVDQETVAVTPKEKVYIIGSYKNNHHGDYDYKESNEGESADGVEVNLGRTIQDFAGQTSGNGKRWDYRVHDKDTSNNSELAKVYSKMSAADKSLTFDKGEAYLVTESGKVIGKVANTQVGKVRDSLKADGSLTDSSFKILENLGIQDNAEKTGSINSEEANGGKIEYNGKTYNVASTILRKNTPLTFDLNGDGVKTSDKIIDFDIDGDGKKDKINDVADGTLCIRGGKSGLDVFGNNTDIDGDGKADGFTDGFQALKALATKEGLINGKDDMVLDANDLKKLEEKYGLAMKTEGYNSEAKSLAEIGLTEIDLSKDTDTKRINNFDGQNNDVLTQSGATFKLNGKTRDYADVLHSIK